MEDEKTIHKDTPRSSRWIFAASSFVFMLVAWVLATLSGWATVASGALAVLLGVVALRSPRKSVRNIAITSIVAASVLVVVVGAFMIFIRYGLD